MVAWMIMPRSLSYAQFLDTGYEPDSLSTPEPVDIVIPWVTTDDPEWLQERNEWAIKCGQSTLPANRHTDNGELRYVLRGIERNMPWVRHVVLLVHQHRDGTPQVPEWLDFANPRLRVVTHPAIFPARDLPTFNSSAIECHVHEIPGLSRLYLYGNDDVIVMRPTTLGDFMHPDGVLKVFLEGGNVPRTPHEKLNQHKRALCKQNRLLDTVFGARERRYPRHVINLRNRALEYEKRRMLPHEWEKASAMRFRSEHDFCDNAFVHFHWCLETGHGREAKTDSAYIAMGSKHPIRIPQQVPKHICFNDTRENPHTPMALQNTHAMHTYLQQYLGTPSSFEKKPPNEKNQ